MDYETAKNLVLKELKNTAFLFRDEEYFKLTLMLHTGIEVTTEGGRIVYPVPVGFTLESLVNTLQGKPSPYKKIRFTGKKCLALVIIAEEDPVAWDAATNLAAIIYEQGDMPPPELQQFVIRVLKGKIRPLLKGRKKEENFYRDQRIAELVYFLKENGYKPATKNSNHSNIKSACDVVADACTKFGIPLSYEGVKSIRGRYI